MPLLSSLMSHPVGTGPAAPDLLLPGSVFQKTGADPCPEAAEIRHIRSGSEPVSVGLLTITHRSQNIKDQEHNV